MMAKRKTTVEIGREGEDLAVEYLLANGYKIIDRNYYTQFGEVDVIASKDNNLIFFEVKTRRNKNFGNPEESIDQKKIESLIITAEHYLEEKIDEEISWQIDLLAIQILRDGKVEIQHFRDINL